MTPPSTTTSPAKGKDVFAVRTRIGRAVGEAGRYACDAVRALPGPQRSGSGAGVVLQATDGHQATCVLTPGHVRGPRLVPTSVLPTRRTQREAHVRLVDGQWQSSEGKLAPDTPATPNTPADAKFPPVADVLPAVGERPFYETPAQADRRRTAASSVSRGNGISDAPESMHVMVSLDVAELAKLADGLGTSKLTLFVPVPVRRRSDRKPPEQTCVNRALPVCPAAQPGDGDVTDGIGVIMPLNIEQSPAHYMRIRQLVREAERRITRSSRRAG